MNKKEILEIIKIYMSERFQMVLATYGAHPWAVTLYYSFDEDLNIFFLSSPETLHCQQIADNPNVAIAIADSPQSPSSKKIGLQIAGTAERISGKSRIIHALDLWKRSLRVTSEKYTYEGMVNKLIDGRMYKVVPKKMKFFNQELWSEGQEPFIDL